VTSNINFAGINEQFPVAGQDNDTQVFRDNFDTIKTSFRTAQTEITDLQDNSARTDLDNDFNLNKISNAVLQQNREQKFNWGNYAESSIGVDFELGSYQIITLGSNVNMQFTNLPGDPAYTGESTPIGMGKITLELYSSGGSYVVNFVTTGGTVFKKDPAFPGAVTISSADNPVFIEVWRHNQNFIFMRYLGQYS
jgi:hypothetical protein